MNPLFDPMPPTTVIGMALMVIGFLVISEGAGGRW